MKNVFLLLAFFSLLSSPGQALAYTSTDVSNANYLADAGLIVKHSTASGYRLDDRITRAEAIGTALKLKWVPLPENYQCQGYYTDTRSNGWICRAIEIAADHGIISRNNMQARPHDPITRAESLAIMIKASLYPLTKPRRIEQPDGSTWSLYEDLKSYGYTQWQADMMDSISDCRIYNRWVSCEDGADLNRAMVNFGPNRAATRAEVFFYVRNLIEANKNTVIVKLTYLNDNASGISEGSICNSSLRLYTENRRIPRVTGILRATIEALLDPANDPESMEFGPWNLTGMYELTIGSLAITDGVAIIHLNHTDEYLANSTRASRLAHVNNQSGGTQFSESTLFCGIKSQITALAKQFPTVQKVRLYINGEFISEE